MVTRAGPPGDRGPGHLADRPGDRQGPFDQPRRRRTEPAPGRDADVRVPGTVRCRDCRRRMGGVAYGRGPDKNVYYQCPHNPKNPRHAAAAPDHPRTVKAPETRLDDIVGLFFNDHVSAPTARSCSPPSSPPPTLPPGPTATPRPPRSAPGCGRSTSPRTPASSNSSSSPPTRPTPPPPRCAAGSAPGSPTYTANANSSTPSSPPWPRPPPAPPTRPCSTSSRSLGTCCPACPRS